VSDLLESEPAGARLSELLIRILVGGVVDSAISALDVNGLVAPRIAGTERIKDYRASEAIGRHLPVFCPPDGVATGITTAEPVAATADGSVAADGWRIRTTILPLWARVVHQRPVL
jgi:hypothetical protein